MEIPAYPASRPLDISDGEIMKPLFKALQPAISEFTFAGLYLFRKAHDYRLSMLGDSLLILGKGYDGSACFLPPLFGNIPETLDILFNDGMKLYGGDEEFARLYLEKDDMVWFYDRDAFDYLYLREELATLPGNRFHKKRNRISYFAARHDYSVEIFSKRHSKGCQELVSKLLQMTPETSISLRLELEAASEGAAMAESLGLEGVVLLTEGGVSGFALGEMLNNETAVCHFEKSDPFMEGAAQFLNREFAARLFTDAIYLNREQDLGEPGLRNAKLSYHPIGMIRKVRGYRKLETGD